MPTNRIVPIVTRTKSQSNNRNNQCEGLGNGTKEIFVTCFPGKLTRRSLLYFHRIIVIFIKKYHPIVPEATDEYKCQYTKLGRYSNENNFIRRCAGCSHVGCLFGETGLFSWFVAACGVVSFDPDHTCRALDIAQENGFIQFSSKKRQGRFVHDRIHHEAAYSLIPEDGKTMFHLLETTKGGDYGKFYPHPNWTLL